MYGEKDRINTYAEYAACMEFYRFTPLTKEQWVRHQKERDAEFCKEWPREFKWSEK
jgi:hypothetical protein